MGGEEELRFLKCEEIIWELSDYIKKANIRILGIPESEENEKGEESLFKEIIAEKAPNLEKELDIQVCKTKSTLLPQCKKPFSKTHYNDTVKSMIKNFKVS